MNACQALSGLARALTLPPSISVAHSYRNTKLGAQSVQGYPLVSWLTKRAVVSLVNDKCVSNEKGSQWNQLNIIILQNRYKINGDLKPLLLLQKLS